MFPFSQVRDLTGNRALIILGGASSSPILGRRIVLMRLQVRMPNAALKAGKGQRPALSTPRVVENPVPPPVHSARPASEAVLPLDAIPPPADFQARESLTPKHQHAKRQIQTNSVYRVGRFIRPAPS